MSRKDFKTFKPVSRELIFDIDMDDYSPVRFKTTLSCPLIPSHYSNTQIRHCCEGANICPKCWKFMNNAMMVLRDILKDEFGFKHILFVYSGRRGIHIWVCDSRARQLTDSQRKAIVDYLSFSSINSTMSFSLE